MSAVSKYIYAGSPFIPDPSPEIMNKIATEARLHREPLQFTVAMEIRTVMHIHAPRLLSQIGELSRKFGTKPQDIALYMLGYDAPLVMVTAAFMAETLGDSVALSKACPPTDNNQARKLNDHVKRNISTYRSMLRKDPTTRLIFLNEEDHPLFKDVYYQVGMQVAKHTYVACMQILTGG